MRRITPSISVGMPVFNGEPYLTTAIQSILDQTFPDFELIISDNASTDRTEEICRGFAARDERVIYTRNERNIGAAANYNRLVELASADYFRWSNADDVFGRELHQRCLSVLEATPDAVLSYGRTTFIDAEGNEIGVYEDNLDLRDERPLHRFMRFNEQVGLTNAVYGLMRTAAVRRTARMGSGSYPSADVNFMGELALQGKFVEIPEPLFYRRRHDAAFSTGPSSDMTRQSSFWGAERTRFRWPLWRRNLAYLRGIGRAPIAWTEKCRLMLYLSRTLYWQRQELMGEMRAAIEG